MHGRLPPATLHGTEFSVQTIIHLAVVEYGQTYPLDRFDGAPPAMHLECLIAALNIQHSTTN